MSQGPTEEPELSKVPSDRRNKPLLLWQAHILSFTPEIHTVLHVFIFAGKNITGECKDAEIMLTAYYKVYDQNKNKAFNYENRDDTRSMENNSRHRYKKEGTEKIWANMGEIISAHANSQQTQLGRSKKDRAS